MHTIKKTPKYLLVTFAGRVAVIDVLNAIQEEFQRADYPAMDDIYHFCGCEAGIKVSDFAAIIETILAKYPAEATRRKTAIVVDPGFRQAMSIMFASEAARSLPYRIQVFPNLAQAESWLDQA